MDFTAINRSVTVVVTIFDENVVMFWVDIVGKIDLSIIVGIIVVDNFNRDTVDIVTIPSSVTGWDVEWTITIDVTVIWAVFISPSIFTIDNALVNFTRINGSIIVIITIFLDLN